MIEETELLSIVTERDFISTDSYLNFARGSGLFIYSKRDFLFKKGYWRGMEQGSVFMGALGKHSNLITGHSDLYLGKRKARILRLTGTKRVFATNAEPVPGYVFPIPQGLTNLCDDSPVHRILGDTDHIHLALESVEVNRVFDGSIYVNFDIKTNRRERLKAQAVARLLPNAYFGKYELNAKGRISYLSDLRRFNFVLCPEGNGVDTVRVWETLYMGGIPIVKKSKCMAKVLIGLPVLWISNWQQIYDLDFLEASWYSINSKIHDGSNLRQSTWNEFILEHSFR